MPNEPTLTRPRRAIASREVTLLATWRILTCGHRIPEPRGGKAKDAQFALCALCGIQKHLASNAADLE